MKKILILTVALTFTACMSREVRMTDPNLEMKGYELYYKGELFTGTVVQQIPFTGQEIKIEYIDGIISDGAISE